MAKAHAKGPPSASEARPPRAHGRKKLFSLRKERDTLAAVLADLEGKEKYDLIQNNARSTDQAYAIAATVLKRGKCNISVA